MAGFASFSVAGQRLVDEWLYKQFIVEDTFQVRIVLAEHHVHFVQIDAQAAHFEQIFELGRGQVALTNGIELFESNPQVVEVKDQLQMDNYENELRKIRILAK